MRGWLSLLALSMATSCAAPSTASTDGEWRIALCQIEITSDVEQNVATIRDWIGRAADEGAQLAVFPEACLFGWTNDAAHAGATTVPGRYVDQLGDAARVHQIMVAVGIEERSARGLHNSVVLLDTDGALLGVHRKVNILSELMDPPYVPGEGAQTVLETRWGRIGLLICADTFEDELVGQLAAQQPDLVLVPDGWAAPAEQWPDHGQSLHAWIAHTARRCQAPVVGVDSTGSLAVGPWAGYVLGGQSMACDASGESLAVLADRTPELRVVTVPRSPAAD